MKSETEKESSSSSSSSKESKSTDTTSAAPASGTPATPASPIAGTPAVASSADNTTEGKATEDAGRTSPTSDSGGSNKPSETSSSEANPEFLYVQRAMDKGERISLLKEQFSASSTAKQRQQGSNLYIKNLDDKVDKLIEDV